jgi:4-hydroxyphenylpyruvate dioxygenase
MTGTAGSSGNALRLKKIEHIDVWVTDADAVADVYRRNFGFVPVAEAGPDTGLAGHRSVVLSQGAAKLVITSSLQADGPVAEFTRLHGDGVRDIAFGVDDAGGAYHAAVVRGAVPVRDPYLWEGGGSRMVRATVKGFGDVVHSFIEWDGPEPACLPFPYRPIAPVPAPTSGAFTAIDHVAMCLSAGTLDDVAEYYKRVLGFVDGHREQVETALSGMNARVVECGPIKFPLQEPLLGNPSGPIAEFVKLNCGAGVYHVALLTDDIVDALRDLSEKTDVKALPTPSRYYDMLPTRVGPIDERVEDLRDLNILVDRDPGGYLLQVFTRSLHERQTLFFEVIQRKGEAKSFGSGNIRALFDAVESDRRSLSGAAGQA